MKESKRNVQEYLIEEEQILMEYSYKGYKRIKVLLDKIFAFIIIILFIILIVYLELPSFITLFLIFTSLIIGLSIRLFDNVKPWIIITDYILTDKKLIVLNRKNELDFYEFYRINSIKKDSDKIVLYYPSYEVYKDVFLYPNFNKKEKDDFYNFFFHKWYHNSNKYIDCLKEYLEDFCTKIKNLKIEEFNSDFTLIKGNLARQSKVNLILHFSIKNEEVTSFKFQVTCPNPSGLYFNIYNENIKEKITKHFNQKDIQLGDSNLDKQFLFESNQDEFFKKINDSFKINLLETFKDFECHIQFGEKIEENQINISNELLDDELIKELPHFKQNMYSQLTYSKDNLKDVNLTILIHHLKNTLKLFNLLASEIEQFNQNNN